MSERPGLINFMARQLMAGRAIPLFVSRAVNMAVERRLSEIIDYRKARRFKAKRAAPPSQSRES